MTGEAFATVRPARPADAQDCARVHVRSWQEAYVGMVPDDFLQALSVRARTDQWEDWLRDEGRAAFVAERDNGEIVGFCLAGPPLHGSAPGFGEIQALYLLQKAYGRGLAEQLMGLGARDLRGRGYTGVTLRVMKANARARAFYERLGGIVAGDSLHETQGLIIEDLEYRWPDIEALTGL